MLFSLASAVPPDAAKPGTVGKRTKSPFRLLPIVCICITIILVKIGHNNTEVFAHTDEWVRKERCKPYAIQQENH